MTALPTLVGKHRRIELRLGEDADAAHAPLIAASEVGFSPLGSATSGSPARRSIQAVSNFMRDSPEGAWLALCQHPEDQRRYALIQSNRSWTPDRIGFYEAHYPQTARVWRDFYYRTTYAILALIDEHWAAEEVVLSHPTGHGWPPDLMPAVLEALGHFADRRPPTSLRRVCLSACCLDGPGDVLEAIKMLNVEQNGPRPPRHRPVTPRPVAPQRFGCAPEDGIQLFRISMPSPLHRRDPPPTS